MPKGEGGLSKDCHARCELIASLKRKHLIRKVGGPIADKYKYAIMVGVKKTIGDFSNVPELVKEIKRLKAKVEELEQG